MDLEDILEDVIRRGDIRHVQGINPRRFKPYVDSLHEGYHFRTICERGFLEAVQWFYQTFEVDGIDNYVFQNTCINGHLPVARWLHKTFGLTAAEVSTRDNQALRGACDNGHLDVVQWLIKTFNISTAVVSMDDLMNRAFGAGQLHTVQWAYSRSSRIAPTDPTRSALLKQWLCITFRREHTKWSRKKHAEWYFGPHTLAAAGHMSNDLLADVMRHL